MTEATAKMPSQSTKPGGEVDLIQLPFKAIPSRAPNLVKERVGETLASPLLSLSIATIENSPCLDRFHEAGGAARLVKPEQRDQERTRASDVKAIEELVLQFDGVAPDGVYRDPQVRRSVAIHKADSDSGPNLLMAWRELGAETGSPEHEQDLFRLDWHVVPYPCRREITNCPAA